MRVNIMIIIVAENDREFRSVFSEVLSEHGHIVHQAVDGLEALTLLASHDVQMVVSDINMPEMNGIELHRQLRNTETYRSLPFLYISGDPHMRASGLIERPDLDFVVNKMVPVQEILALMNDISARREKVGLTQ
jgi:CheY-like chemotaxis protein